MSASKSSGLAVVTGASAGIGLELARQLSRAGRPVLAIARRAERLQALAEEAKSGGWGAIHPMAEDLLLEGAAERIALRARELGGASWLVNNAGVALFGPFLESSPAQSVQQLRLNCEALVSLTHAVLPGLVDRGEGVVLNVASSAGFQATPFMTVYGATKAFVVSFTEGLGEELRGTGVSVTALCPGPVRTEIFEVGAPGVPRQSVAGELSAQACAEAGIRAAQRGDVICVPGAMTKMKAWTVKLLPRAVIRRSLGKIGLGTLGLPRTGRSQ